LFEGYRNTDYNCYLAGARREKNHYFTNEDKAYNDYLQQLFGHINDGHISTYMTRQEAE
jgi:regulator of sigma D